MTKMLLIITQIFLILLLIALGCLSVFGLKKMWLCRASTKWPSTIGQKISFEMKVDYKDNGNGETTKTSTNICHYTYTVGDKTYEGNTIGFTYMSGGPTSSQDNLSEKLSSMKTIKVFYNPENPAQSTLTTASNPIFNGFILLGVVMSGFIIYMMMWLWFNNTNVASQIITN